jgi:hypothetical protein
MNKKIMVKAIHNDNEKYNEPGELMFLGFDSYKAKSCE